MRGRVYITRPVANLRFTCCVFPELLLEAVHRRRERIASQRSEQSAQGQPQPPAQPQPAPPAKTKRKGKDKQASKDKEKASKSEKGKGDSRGKSRSVETDQNGAKRDSTASSMSVPVIRISKEDSVELVDEQTPQDSLRKAEPQETPAQPRHQVRRHRRGAR